MSIAQHDSTCRHTCNAALSGRVPHVVGPRPVTRMKDASSTTCRKAVLQMARDAPATPKPQGACAPHSFASGFWSRDVRDRVTWVRQPRLRIPAQCHAWHACSAAPRGRGQVTGEVLAMSM